MYNNLCVAIIRLVLSVFYMLLRIASLSLNVKFQFRRVVNVSLFSNSSIFFSRGWEQLEVTCNPIVHHSHNLWNVEGHENERGEKEKQQCVNYLFGSVLQKHQWAAFFSGVLANLIRHCIIEKKLIYLFQCKININTCWLMFIMVGFSTIIYLAVSSKSISGWHIFCLLISEVLANLNRQMKEHACFSLIEIF